MTEAAILPHPSSTAFAGAESSQRSNCTYAGTLRRCGQNCRLSPFDASLLAVASADLFGLAGAGSVELFRLQEEAAAPRRLPPAAPSGSAAAAAGAVLPLRCLAVLPHAAAVNDACWSEADPRRLVSGGSGTERLLSVWEVLDEGASARLCGRLSGHSGAVSCLHWSCVDKRVFASGGWDGRLLLWEGTHGRLLRVLKNSDAPTRSCVAAASSTPSDKAGEQQRSSRVFGCATSPHEGSVLAAVFEDGILSVLDARLPEPGAEAARIEAHSSPALALDWLKHRQKQILSGGADGSVALWDLRKPQRPLLRLNAHGLAVRRVAADPFCASRFASCSYDLTVKLWTLQTGSGVGEDAPKDTEKEASDGGGGSCWVGLQAVLSHHREFVQGLEWSVFERGLLCSTAWDKGVAVWKADGGACPPLVPKRALLQNGP